MSTRTFTIGLATAALGVGAVVSSAAVVEHTTKTRTPAAAGAQASPLVVPSDLPAASSMSALGLTGGALAPSAAELAAPISSNASDTMQARISSLSKDAGLATDENGQPTAGTPAGTAESPHMLLKGAGRDNTFVVAFKAPGGKVCDVTLRFMGCVSRFRATHPIAETYIQIGQTGNWYITGLAPDTVKALEMTAAGKAYPVTVKNNALYGELPAGTRSPSSYTATLADGSKVTFLADS